MSCGTRHKFMVELALAEVHNSGAHSQLSLSFCHSSEVSERGFASRSWHESSVIALLFSVSSQVEA